MARLDWFQPPACEKQPPPIMDDEDAYKTEIDALAHQVGVMKGKLLVANRTIARQQAEIDELRKHLNGRNYATS